MHSFLGCPKMRVCGASRGAVGEMLRGERWILGLEVFGESMKVGVGVLESRDADAVGALLIRQRSDAEATA